MKQKRTKLLAVAALMLAVTFVSTTSAKADGSAPGEGFYAGAFVGFGTGILQGKVEVLEDTASNNTELGTFETERGGIGLSGIQGGAWAGWGMKTADDIYFGAEITGLGSDEKFTLTSTNGIELDGGGLRNENETQITKISAQRMWTAGGAVRVGYYVNKDTLFSLKGGIAVSQFDLTIGSQESTYYAGGPQMGGSIETRLSKIDPNLSLRMEYVFTDYLTADILGDNNTCSGCSTNNATGNNSTVTGHDSAGRIGVQYSF
jgi:hypothetical protein